MYCIQFLEMFSSDGLQWSQMSFFLRYLNEFLSPSDLSPGSLEVVWVYGIDYLLHMTPESVLISWDCILGFCVNVLIWCVCQFNQFYPKLTISFYFNGLKFYVCRTLEVYYFSVYFVLLFTTTHVKKWILIVSVMKSWWFHDSDLC